jgi:plasmid stabilization system protein ParE
VSDKRYELSNRADRDLAAILRESGRRFGRAQQEKYAQLLLAACEWAAADPERSGSKAYDEISPGLIALRVDRAASRHGAAAHVLFYRRTVLKDGAQGIRIVRILHEYMDPARYLIGR